MSIIINGKFSQYNITKIIGKCVQYGRSGKFNEVDGKWQIIINGPTDVIDEAITKMYSDKAR